RTEPQRRNLETSKSAAPPSFRAGAPGVCAPEPSLNAGIWRQAKARLRRAFARGLRGCARPNRASTPESGDMRKRGSAGLSRGGSGGVRAARNPRTTKKRPEVRALREGLVGGVSCGGALKREFRIGTGVDRWDGWWREALAGTSPASLPPLSDLDRPGSAQRVAGRSKRPGSTPPFTQPPKASSTLWPPGSTSSIRESTG
ncbi:MAG: hypothetical protein H6P99_2830, partial [Holophagaceae bacterium]|nr:hypothetical protein [Holophagaceae bacterium]